MEKLDLYLKDLICKDENKAQIAADYMINSSDIELFKMLVDKSDFLFDFIRNNISKYIELAVSKENYWNILKFFDIYSVYYDDLFASILSRHANQNLTEEIFKNYRPLAPAGGLSPYSRTSFDWDNKKWPIKPDVVFEGGNLAQNNSEIDSPTDLSILSTSKDTQTKYFDVINATSCATAKASWFCAQLYAKYPNLSPETIRGLVVHSANWNNTMRKQFWDSSKTTKDNYKTLLRTFGYGVPNLNKALYSARNSLTLIAEEVITPYYREGSSKPKTKDMHIIELPWPQEVLLSLPSETMLDLKVTLSYFIEPAPGQLAWKERYRYQSHALRFALNLPGDNKETFKKKLSVASRNEDESIPSTTDNRWELGVNNRNTGSIHSDFIKNISAAELATTRYVGVYPVTGWWKERQHLGKFNNSVKYSLIVSIDTPNQEIDLYTPIKIALTQQIPIY